MGDKYDAFICYSHRNAGLVDRLAEDLKQAGIKVWQDALELQVGQSLHSRIQEGIERSDWLCLVLSPASIRSFYVRRIELESALQKMVEEQRDDFILPLRLGPPTKEERRFLPAIIRSKVYLRIDSQTNYCKSVPKLIDRIRPEEASLSGERWFKNIDTTTLGRMVGLGSLKYRSERGCVLATYENGLITKLTFYSDGGRESSRKTVGYDRRRRVASITLLQDGREVDTWLYRYSPRTGYRTEKLVAQPGKAPHVRWTYDRTGKKLTEERLLPNGRAEVINGVARKAFEYDKKGALVAEKLLDSRGRLVKRVAFGV